MKVPEFARISTQRKLTSTFGGVNRTPGLSEGEFVDDINMTSSAYPALASRPLFGVMKSYGDLANRQIPLIAWNDGLVELIPDSGDGYDRLYYKGEEVAEYAAKQLSRYGWVDPLPGVPAEHREAVCFNRMVIFLPYMTFFDCAAYDAREDCCGKLYNVRNIGVGAKLYPMFEDGNYILAASVTGQDFPQAASSDLPSASGQDGTTITGRWDDADREGAAYYQLKDGSWALQNNFRFRIDYTSGSGMYPRIDEGFHVGDIVDIETMTVTVGGEEIELGLGTQFTIDELGEGYIVIRAGAFDSIAFAGLMNKCFTAVPGTTRKKCVTLTHLQIARRVPELSYACVSHNRIFGCDSTGHEIYACYQGDPFVWYNYFDEDLSAWTATVGTPGTWSGCAAYENKVLFFKRNRIHVLSGGYPSSFTLTDVESPGAWISYSDFSDAHAQIQGCSDMIPIAYSDGALYFGGADGVYRWYGGIATRISDKLGSGRYYFYDMFAVGHILYVTAILPGTFGPTTYSYDVARDIWHKIGSLLPLCHAYVNSGVLAVSYGKIVAFGVVTSEYESGPVAWSFETGPLAGLEPDRKYLSKIQICADLGYRGEISVFLQYNEDGFWRKYKIPFPDRRRVELLPIIPRRCDSVRMKVSGSGGVTVYTISYYYERSTELGTV